MESYVRESQTPRVNEKCIILVLHAVPTTDTGALAEKAKTCREKPIKGIRHIGPVASAEGVSIFVSLEMGVH